MLKNSLVALSFTTLLLSGCGGSGSSSDEKTVQNNSENKSNKEEPTSNEKTVLKSDTYDLSEYFFNPKILSENKKIIHATILSDYYKNSNDVNNTTAEHIYLKDDSASNKINYYYALDETKFSSFTIEKDKLIEFDSEDNSITNLKRNIKIGDEVLREKKNNSEDFVCNFAKHYSNINFKSKVKEYLNKDISINKEFSDVIELSCKDNEEKNNIYFAKNIGKVFFIGKREESNDIKYYYNYLEKQRVLSR